MNDPTWGDETAAPAKKGVPKWIFFCCGGCLLALVVGALALKVGFDQVKDWSEADQQLPVLQEALPFDPLPSETEFEFAIRFPMNWFIFTDSRGYVMLFFLAGAGDGGELRRTLLNPDFEGPGMGRRIGPTEANVTLQGRDVRGLRFVQEAGAGNESGGAAGQSILLEVGPDAGSHVVIVQITRRSSEEPITDEEVRTLLRPFHVGPDR